MNNDLNYNLDLLLDYIYDKSVLTNFLSMVKVEKPHFTYYIDTDVRPFYCTLDAKRCEIKIPMINTILGHENSETFIKELAIQSQLVIEKDFIDFVDKKSSLLNTERIAFKDKFKFPFRFYKSNNRFRLKNKQIELITHNNFISLIEKTQNEIFNKYRDDVLYAIIPPNLINFFINEITTYFSINDERGIKLLGNFHLLQIYVNFNSTESNVIYFGTTKKQSYGNGRKPLMLAHYNSENAYLQYNSYTDRILDIERIYLLNLFHKIIDANNESFFKKIIIEL